MKKCSYRSCEFPRLDGQVYCQFHYQQWDETVTLGVEKKLIATIIQNSEERDYSRMCLGCLTDLFDELVENRGMHPDDPLIVEIISEMESRLNEKDKPA